MRSLEGSNLSLSLVAILIVLPSSNSGSFSVQLGYSHENWVTRFETKETKKKKKRKNKW